MDRRIIVVGVVSFSLVVTDTAIAAVRSGSGSSAPATVSANGLFPSVFDEPGPEPRAVLIKQVGAAAGTSTFTMTASAPEIDTVDLVINCTGGGYQVTIGPGVSSGHCDGRPKGVIGICSGGTYTFQVTVDRPQTRRWGLAAYVAGQYACN